MRRKRHPGLFLCGVLGALSYSLASTWATFPFLHLLVPSVLIWVLATCQILCWARLSWYLTCHNNLQGGHCCPWFTNEQTEAHLKGWMISPCNPLTGEPRTLQPPSTTQTTFPAPYLQPSVLLEMCHYYTPERRHFSCYPYIQIKVPGSFWNTWELRTRLAYSNLY